MSVRNVVAIAGSAERRRTAVERPGGVLSDDGGSADLEPGQLIRDLRRASGLTQDQLARATGVSRSAVAQWETGRASYGNKLVLLAKALAVPVWQLERDRTDGDRRVARVVHSMSTQELTLLSHFRELADADQACMLTLARRLAVAPRA